MKEADNADNALAQVAAQWPEVLVLDLPAPRLQGYSNDVDIRMLRALAERPDRPGMVAFAVDPDAPTAQAARELGAVAVLDRHATIRCSRSPAHLRRRWRRQDAGE